MRAIYVATTEPTRTIAIPGPAWSDPTAGTSAAAANANEQANERAMPGPAWTAGTPAAAGHTFPTDNGKHPSVRCHLHGTVVAAAAQSKRLLFFSVVCEDSPGVPWRCIAKVADGFLSPAQIAELTARLQPGATVCLLAFPELAPSNDGPSEDGVARTCPSGRQVWLHTVSYFLGKPYDSLPALPPAHAVSAAQTSPDGEAENAAAADSGSILAPTLMSEESSVSKPGRRARKEAGGGPSRVRPNNGARHQIFVGWLVNTFGQVIICFFSQSL